MVAADAGPPRITQKKPMLIVCPTCAMSYQVDASAIGTSGRSVRCTQCKTVWVVAAPEEELFRAPKSAGDETVAAFRTALGAETTPPPSAAGEPSATHLTDNAMPEGAAPSPSNEQQAALADITIPIENAPPLVPEAEDGARPAVKATAIDNDHNDVETVAARRRTRPAARRRHSRPRSRLPAVIVVLLTTCVALLAWRKDIVRHVPQLASFYSAIWLPVNLRGLAFTDVKISNQMHDGVPVLVVEGVIVSTASMPVEVPRLRFSVLNVAGVEIYAWTAMPSQPVLTPEESLPFYSQLASPPVNSHSVQVRFFTHRDAAVAGLP